MSLHVAIVGATGAVGRELISSLSDSSIPISQLSLLASARSEGQTIKVGDQEHTIRALGDSSFEGVDLALFSAGGARSKEFAPLAVKSGCVVVDNSSAFRMDPTVPLIVPEVNAGALADHQGIIANPNCSTTQLVLPLMALHQAAELRRVIISTYQSASGAGQSGVDELWAGARAALAGEPIPNKVFSRPLAFDVIPQIDSFHESGYTLEERKMLFETRKILGIPNLPSSATCVRVPVARGHSEAVTVDLGRPISANEAREVMASFPGITVMDDPSTMTFPVARDSVGSTQTFVGRIRVDEVLPGTIHFWVVSDNLLKGAAANAVQIAESLHEQGLVRVP